MTLGNIDMSDAVQMLRNPEGIEDLLLEEHEDTGIPPAAFFADVFNILRADTARLAEVHGVEVEIERMTPDRAAELMADLANPHGGQGKLLAAFNEEAERRDKILREALSDEEYDKFMAAKINSLYSSAERPGEDTENEEE